MQSNRKHRRRSLAAGLASLLLCSSLTGALAAPSLLETLRAKLAAISRKIDRQEDRVREVRARERRLSEQFEESQARLDAAEAELRRTQQRLAAAQAAVAEATRRLQAAEARLRAHQRAFGRRLHQIYKEGSVTYLDVLLGATSLDDYLDREYYVRRIIDSDAQLLRALRAAYQEVQAERAALVRRQQEVAALHAEIQDRVATVQQETERHAALLRQVRSDRAYLEEQLRQLEEDSNEIERAIAEELRRRARARRSGSRQYRDLPRWTGRWLMPARGPITSGFGPRFHPILKYHRMHYGIDIGAPHGAPVYAAASGEVYLATRYKGYGNCIILLHGGGVATLYGHLSRIAVRPGQAVRRGQVIGYVGSTGMSTGPHLHFEVRRNGRPVNPRP